MLIIFTGNGKGKTTAAIGQAIRVIGWGKKVLMIQFIKGNDWPSGEEKTVAKLKPFFVIKKFGIGFLTNKKNTEKLAKHKESAEMGWKYAKKQAESGRWDLIILDEINVAINLKLLESRDIFIFLKKHKDKFFILTGRNALRSFIKIADLVTEMKEIKHPYKKGIVAKEGIEY